MRCWASCSLMRFWQSLMMELIFSIFLQLLTSRLISSLSAAILRSSAFRFSSFSLRQFSHSWSQLRGYFRRLYFLNLSIMYSSRFYQMALRSIATMVELLSMTMVSLRAWIPSMMSATPTRSWASNLILFSQEREVTFTSLEYFWMGILLVFSICTMILRAAEPEWMTSRSSAASWGWYRTSPRMQKCRLRLENILSRAASGKILKICTEVRNFRNMSLFWFKQLEMNISYSWLGRPIRESPASQEKISLSNLFRHTRSPVCTCLLPQQHSPPMQITRQLPGTSSGDTWMIFLAMPSTTQVGWMRKNSYSCFNMWLMKSM